MTGTRHLPGVVPGTAASVAKLGWWVASRHVRLDEKISEARTRAEEARWDTCLVVNEERILLGVLGENELSMENDSTVEDSMRPGPTTFRPHLPIAEMAEYLVENDLETIPITASEGRLVGLLRRDDALPAAHERHSHHH